ncbi:Acetylcholine receptor-like protein cup-4 [Toxocara canis]|uniref:Acetylcholine receptor-like protein cup-4 n=1 Tax=Toxocara canis TaxID=6265 RepID=A0A0B2VQF6_TOXCA|nr:Acetylcholine receptor-like protein cup-4 [Toxocara canis]
MEKQLRSLLLAQFFRIKSFLELKVDLHRNSTICALLANNWLGNLMSHTMSFFEDEHEQTMMLHGLLWATWIDEYMQWEPSKYNNTRRIAIESWKIWQPALSLYNSARGNGWYLHMGGLPASVSSDGKVWASGSFSFHVTCMFDFTNYPYDEQECPIVVADWVYDLSKVNLSDPSGNTPWNKPAVKLSYDPLSNNEPKKHVAAAGKNGLRKDGSFF